jgi:opacity protein-like surface antigen
MKKMLLTFVLTISVLFSNAQFQQKFTAQASLGYSKPSGKLADNFSGGLTFDCGLQYNFSRSFSIAALLKYATFFYEAPESMAMESPEGKYNNFGISLCPKIKFLPNKKLHPYILAGGSLNFIKYTISFYNEEMTWESPACFGYTGGMGLEYDITENFTLFIHSGYNNVNFKSDDDGAVQREENHSSMFFQAGININLFKSKTL